MNWLALIDSAVYMLILAFCFVISMGLVYVASLFGTYGMLTLLAILIIGVWIHTYRKMKENQHVNN